MRTPKLSACIIAVALKMAMLINDFKERIHDRIESSE